MKSDPIKKALAQLGIFQVPKHLLVDDREIIWVRRTNGGPQWHHRPPTELVLPEDVEAA